jgi:hypothetical protein
VQICPATTPSGTLTLSGTLDTATASACKAYSVAPGQQPLDACVITAQSIVVTGTLTVTGSRPLVIIGASTIRVSAGSVIDISSRHSPSRSGAGANPPQCAASASGSCGTDCGGGGGGSFGGAGGDGGDGANTGGGGNAASATTTVDVLRGGCGGANGGGIAGGGAGPGGGAIALLAGTAIMLDGAIDASGAGGNGAAGLAAGGGGGHDGSSGDGGGGGGDGAGVILLYPAQNGFTGPRSP